MKTIAYSSPFVPPEWIAAHGFEPLWAPWHRTHNDVLLGLREGVCPYAGAVVDTILAERSGETGRQGEGETGRQGDARHTPPHVVAPSPPLPFFPSPFLPPSAVVLATTCDQMRHAAGIAATRGGLPVFLMNAPATWQTRAACTLYREELERLGRFLVALGGGRPTHNDLVETMFRYNEARAAVQAAQAELSPRQFAAAIAEVRGGARKVLGTLRVPMFPHAEREEYFANAQARVPLAIVGGPLPPQDEVLFDLIEQVGGYIVLDATEGGQRTLPASFDRQRAEQNPLEELCAAYFGSIPDVFRRPNSRLYDWLGREMAARGVRGILFRRYVWCDLWHAELQRLKQWSPVPVLDADVADDDGVPTRLLGRLEAFVEMLRQKR